MTELSEIGARRLPSVEGPCQEVVDALRGYDTTDLSDAMHGSHHMEPGIRALDADMPRFAGPAVTVSVPAGSQEVRRIAMDMARKGDVLVIDSRGIANFAVLGGKLAKRLKQQQLAGVVINGFLRDPEEIKATGLPVHCRGYTVAAAPKTGAGEVNVPIACGGVAVRPGDVVVADNNGVVVIPQECAADLVRKLSSKTLA